MKIQDVMTGPVVSIDENESVECAAQMMQQHNIGCIPVMSGDKLRGIITDRDIVVRSIAISHDFKTQKVRDIMTTDVYTVSSSNDVTTASDIMANDKIRRLPVIDDGKVVGLISIGDIATTNQYMFEASDALSEISFGCHKKH